MKITSKSIDFLIIGAAKAGTTSLASWLGKHPDVCMSSPKETMFFGSPKLFDRGLDWFHANFFSHYQGESLLGDATPAYSNRDRHPGTPERVFRANPAVKIIYIVRNPIRKAESSWQMYANLSPSLVNTPEHKACCLKAKEGFDVYISDPAILANMISVCKYSFQLAPWISTFGQANTHVMFLEDLRADQDSEMRSLCNFLGLDPDPLITINLQAENTLKERRTQRKYVRCLTKTGMQKLLPQGFKSFLARNPLMSFAQSTKLKPCWPDSVLDKFTEAVQGDLKNFLNDHSKPEDYYSLQ